jgi:hypothetical protein
MEGNTKYKNPTVLAVNNHYCISTTAKQWRRFVPRFAIDTSELK